MAKLKPIDISDYWKPAESKGDYYLDNMRSVSYLLVYDHDTGNTIEIELEVGKEYTEEEIETLVEFCTEPIDYTATLH